MGRELSTKAHVLDVHMHLPTTGSQKAVEQLAGTSEAELVHEMTRAQGTHGGSEHFAHRELAGMDSGYQVLAEPRGIHTEIKPSIIPSSF